MRTRSVLERRVVRRRWPHAEALVAGSLPDSRTTWRRALTERGEPHDQRMHSWRVGSRAYRRSGRACASVIELRGLVLAISAGIRRCVLNRLEQVQRFRAPPRSLCMFSAGPGLSRTVPDQVCVAGRLRVTLLRAFLARLFPLVLRCSLSPVLTCGEEVKDRFPC